MEFKLYERKKKNKTAKNRDYNGLLMILEMTF